jgi:MFS family permease
MNAEATTQLRHLRRNLILFAADYIIFGASIALISPSAVIPDFVSLLTDNEAIIGLSGSLFHLMWLLPQLLFAQIISRRSRRKPFMSFTVVPFRISMGIMAALIALLGGDQPTGILFTFLSFYILFAVGDGLVTIVWVDLLGNTLPPRWRSMLFMVAQIGVAIATLGSREVVRHLLGPNGPAFPQNYALLFGIATVGFVIGGVCLVLLREEESGIPIEPGPPMRQYLAYLGTVLRSDRDFRVYIAIRVLFDLTTMSVPFYVIFGIGVLKLERDVLIGDSILIGTVGTSLASLLVGWVSRRSGSRAVIRLMGIGSLLHPALALLSIFAGPPALYASLFLNGAIHAAFAPGYFDWLITHAQPDRRPIYIGLANTISAVSYFSPFFGGIILERTSYTALFALSASLALIGLVVSIFLSEPRLRAAPALSGITVSAEPAEANAPIA